jgi:hypothetical protein
MLIQFNLLRLNNEQLSETIQRVLSDKTSSNDEKSVARWMREYCDNIPYEKRVKEEILNKILFVKNIDDIQKIPFQTTRYGHQSNIYQAINTKKLIQELITKGIYLQNYFQSQTKWRGKNAFLLTAQKESRELQVVHCIDHATLRDAQNNHVFLEIFRKTGLAPSIEIRNAHTGKNACFMIISLMNTDFKSFGLKSTYHQDSLFGIRLEHRDLGENYSGLYDAIERLTIQYSTLLDIIVSMQSQYLSDETRKIVEKKLKEIIFGKSIDNYECDLNYLFDSQFKNRLSLWDRMLFIQEQLYKEIPYIYIDKDDKKSNRKKKISTLKWSSHQKILGKLFELFEQQLKTN